jgi:hypothetical protein
MAIGRVDSFGAGVISMRGDYMIQQRPCVNGILAAVLSASILPIHGALAKEKTPATHKTAKHAVKKIDKQETPKEDPMKSDAGSGAAAPSTPQ